jgi:uncharacterized cupin superfamily protein
LTETDPLIVTSRLDRELALAPIEPSWIRSGSPVARNSVLSTSADGDAATILWECSAGEFDWHYGIDETVYILEGAVIIQSDSMPATRYSAGDVIFFKRGASARWRVEERIRKLAFCRQVRDPLWIRIPRGLWRRLRALVSSDAETATAGSGIMMTGRPQDP